MPDSKLSLLPAADALADADELYVVQDGVSKRTDVGAIKSAIGEAFDGIVDTYSDLPTAVPPHTTAIYLVRQSSGTWLINRKQRGLYQRISETGVRDTDWQYLGEWLEEFSDANFNLYNVSDNTKQLAFDLSGISTGTKRTLTIPNASGILVLNDNTATLTNKTWNGVAIGVAFGGTGLASYAVGDLLFASGTTALSKLADVAAGSVLVSGGILTAPAWNGSTPVVISAGLNNTSVGLTTPNTGDFTTLRCSTTGVAVALDFIGGTGTFQQQVAADGTANGNTTFYKFANDAGGVILQLLKNRSATIGTTKTAITSGDTLGQIQFGGADGTSYIRGARLIVIATANFTSGAGSADLVISTSTANAFVEHARFRSDLVLVLAGGITTVGGAVFHTTSSNLTNGAGAGAGTITNAPSAGNPTKWIGINDNGTTRYVPAW